MSPLDLAETKRSCIYRINFPFLEEMTKFLTEIARRFIVVRIFLVFEETRAFVVTHNGVTNTV